MKRIEEHEESSAQRERERERERKTEVHKLRHYDDGVNTLGSLPEMEMAAGSRT
jgi:hypothetical protein